MGKDDQDDFMCCDSPSIHDNGRGEMVCLSCGIIHGSALVMQRPRVFEDGERSKKINNAKRSLPYGNRTVIPHSVAFPKLNKLKRSNSMLNAEEKNLSIALPKFTAIAERHYIPDYVLSAAWKVYKECVKRKFLVGRSIEEFIIISTYLASRVKGFPILLTDILEEFDMDAKGINRLSMEVIRSILPLIGMKFKPINIQAYLKRFGLSLGLYPTEISKAVAISALLNNRMLGKDPKGVCAAILYSLGGRTQTEVARACKVTEVTLRSRAAEITRILNQKRLDKKCK